MADYGAKFADRKIRKVDRQLQAEYRQAEKELKEKLADFVRRSKAQDAYKRKQVEAGIITEKEYEDWLKGQVFQKKRWESKIKSVQEIMHNHNVEAAKMIHENKLDVYNENYLYQQYEMEMITGMSFDIYSEKAVTKLIKDREQLLPEWKIDEEKDYKWNYRKVNNAVTQGIIQGESVDKIMARLARDLCSMNENKMRMFARTAITGAQNAGHQQQMADAEKELGIKQLKQWVATLDMRTRDTHRHLDGQEVPYDKPFHSDLGLIRFPGDPEAEPGNVYNCRCDMITIYPEYRTEQDNWREKERINGLSYEEWKDELSQKRAAQLKQYIPYKTDIKLAEKKISNKPVEIGVCIDRKTGRTLFTTTTNERDRVRFTKQQLLLAHNQTLTHNHPDGGTFSSADVQLAFDYGIREIRAQSGKRVYSLLRMFDVNDAIPGKYYDFVNDYNTALIRQKNDIDRIFNRTHNVDKCNRLIEIRADKWLRKNAKKYGWRYSVEWME